jgi:hypothetical protein
MGKSVPCIKIDDVPEQLLIDVTANNFDNRSGPDLVSMKEVPLSSAAMHT